MTASIVGRGMRFFHCKYRSNDFWRKIKDHIEFVIVGATVVIIAFFYFLYKKDTFYLKLKATAQLCRVQWQT